MNVYEFKTCSGSEYLLHKTCLPAQCTVLFTGLLLLLAWCCRTAIKHQTCMHAGLVHYVGNLAQGIVWMPTNCAIHVALDDTLCMQ